MTPWLLPLCLLATSNHDGLSIGLRKQNPEQQNTLVDKLLKRYSPSDLLQVQPSEACGGGLGVFARSEIAPKSVVAEIPVTYCVTIHSKVDSADNEYSKLESILTEFLVKDGPKDVGPISREGIVVSIKLLLQQRANQGNMDNSKVNDNLLRAYVSSLPWDEMPSQHPLLDENYANPGPVWEKARRDAKIAESLLQQAEIEVTATPSLSLFDECLAGVALVQSRAFQLFKAELPEHRQKIQPHCAMVPVLDLFNHPSMSALQYYKDHQFLELPISQATIAWGLVEKEGNNNSNLPSEFKVQVRSPKGIHLQPGQEIWNWYGDGGFVSDPVARQQGKRWDYDANQAFVEMYGFDPWK